MKLNSVMVPGTNFQRDVGRNVQSIELGPAPEAPGIWVQITSSRGLRQLMQPHGLLLTPTPPKPEASAPRSRR